MSGLAVRRKLRPSPPRTQKKTMPTTTTTTTTTAERRSAGVGSDRLFPTMAAAVAAAAAAAAGLAMARSLGARVHTTRTSKSTTGRWCPMAGGHREAARTTRRAARRSCTFRVCARSRSQRGPRHPSHRPCHMPRRLHRQSPARARGRRPGILVPWRRRRWTGRCPLSANRCWRAPSPQASASTVARGCWPSRCSRRRLWQACAAGRRPGARSPRRIPIAAPPPPLALPPPSRHRPVGPRRGHVSAATGRQHARKAGRASRWRIALPAASARAGADPPVEAAGGAGTA